MSMMPDVVEGLLDAALVAELAVVRADGQAVVHPLIPLWDGQRVYMTSSVLFSKKLERIKRNGRVSLSISDPAAVGGMPARCTIQGDARVIEDDIHTTWERLLPLWRAKEPGIDFFLGKRVALPLFFERSIIEITPRRVLWWRDGDTSKAPEVRVLGEVAA
jgi:nitroimidazol reductase NimA-like FMN-containing flavoprotein (pyridoxamine 5'-phosphate oxidase superfamily)